MEKTNRPNRPHYFDEPEARDTKSEFSGNKRKRGQKNAKKTRKHNRPLDGGLEGHAENLIGHKKPGHSHENKWRSYK